MQTVKNLLKSYHGVLLLELPGCLWVERRAVHAYFSQHSYNFRFISELRAKPELMVRVG